ncbi:hypothetical protein AOLI_G00016080 [Acnodon oligacanthus]
MKGNTKERFPRDSSLIQSEAVIRTRTMVLGKKKTHADIVCNSVQAPHLLGCIEPSGAGESEGQGRGQSYLGAGGTPLNLLQNILESLNKIKRREGGRQKKMKKGKPGTANLSPLLLC